MTRDEALKTARATGASVTEMCRELGVNQYRYYRLKGDNHWLTTAVLLEAARRISERRGTIGLQTDLIHFTGEPSWSPKPEPSSTALRRRTGGI